MFPFLSFPFLLVFVIELNIYLLIQIEAPAEPVVADEPDDVLPDYHSIREFYAAIRRGKTIIYRPSFLLAQLPNNPNPHAQSS